MRDVGRRRGRVGPDEEASEEEKEKEEERVPRRRNGGGGKKERGVRRGELPTTRSPSIPRAGTADTCLRHYTRTLAASFLPLSLSLPSSVILPLPRPLPRAASYVYARVHIRRTRAPARPICELA